jgi:hypothetical protein
LRASIEKDDVDDYTRKFQYTTLLLDETYRQSQLSEEKRQFNTQFSEEKRLNAEKMQMAAQELGIDGYKAQTSRVNAATSAKNAATRAAQVELNAAREDRQGLKDKASIRQADERIRIAKEKLRLQKAKDSGKGSAAQKGEIDLALDIMRDEEILGKVNPDFPEEGRQGKKTREEARVYITGLAEAAMPYRGKSDIAKWVAARLKALYPPAPRRSGR